MVFRCVEDACAVMVQFICTRHIRHIGADFITPRHAPALYRASGEGASCGCGAGGRLRGPGRRPGAAREVSPAPTHQEHGRALYLGNWRQEKVVRIYLNMQSAWRLIRAFCAEQHEEGAHGWVHHHGSVPPMEGKRGANRRAKTTHTFT